MITVSALSSYHWKFKRPDRIGFLVVSGCCAVTVSECTRMVPVGSGHSHVISDRGFVALAISVILLMNNCGGGVGVLEEFI